VRPALSERPQRLSQLRPPAGTARRRLTVGLVAVLGIAAGACGGASVSVDVPSTVPVLTVPTGTTPTDDTSTTSTTSTSTSTTATTDTTAQAPAQQAPAQQTPAQSQQQAQPDSSSGGAAPQTSQPQTQQQQAPDTSGGTGGAEFEDYCKQNPGAC
jgi:hypothetical protein